MIEFKNVTKYYGKTKALDNFSWKVKKGEIHALLGHNGSGKTTSFLIANSITKFQSGEVLIFDKNISELSSSDIQKIGLLTEKLKIYDDLTIKETLDFFCNIFNVKNKSEKIKEMSKLFDFDFFINKRIKQLSTGMYKKVVIAITLINDPLIVFLDEPFSGLDPIIIKQISKILLDYNKNNNTTFIISSHNLHEIEELADTITIMKSGKPVVSEKLESLYKKYNIRKSYSLSYLLNNKETCEKISDEEHLTTRLIELKKENSVILSIHENKVTLTDIYNKIYTEVKPE